MPAHETDALLAQPRAVSRERWHAGRANDPMARHRFVSALAHHVADRPSRERTTREHADKAVRRHSAWRDLSDNCVDTAGERIGHAAMVRLLAASCRQGGHTREDVNDLLARVRGMHALWNRGVADLSPEQINHVERPGILPIAFTLVHYVRGEDGNAVELLDADRRLWDEHASRIRFEGVDPRRGTPIAEAERVRIGDADAWRAYQRAVFDRTEKLLAGAGDELLDRVMFEGKRPETLKGGFLGAYVSEGPIRRRNALEAFIFQHGSRHLGELEHARSLVGLGGLS